MHICSFNERSIIIFFYLSCTHTTLKASSWMSSFNDAICRLCLVTSFWTWNNMMLLSFVFWSLWKAWHTSAWLHQWLAEYLALLVCGSSLCGKHRLQRFVLYFFLPTAITLGLGFVKLCVNSFVLRNGMYIVLSLMDTMLRYLICQIKTQLCVSQAQVWKCSGHLQIKGTWLFSCLGVTAISIGKLIVLLYCCMKWLFCMGVCFYIVHMSH